ncbi:hypothetical protein [Ornithinimicrobium cavernae]|uniref:hypothetical protein n=1 Tax=Ornithinimicrobium cavernae TaxID=2666047 RepID=UPI0012B182AB|nr:hypothetical protein [Ornithinimicrobium cavernae]
MTTRRSRIRRLTGAALAVPLMAGAAVVAPAPMAQAHDNRSSVLEWRDTSECPCYLWDEYDGTYFQRDVGGEAFRGRIYSGGELVGKVEFHPYGEKLWVYDTKANGDALYVTVTWGEHEEYGIKVPSGGGTVRDLGNIPEGEPVRIKVWDDGFYEDELFRAWVHA